MTEEENDIESQDYMSETADDLLDSEEEELSVPDEENDARQVNTGNIMAVGLIACTVIFLLVFVAMNLSGRKKKAENSELDKAGTKTAIEFRDLPIQFTSKNEQGIQSKNDEDNVEKPEDSVEDALASLPPELQLPKQNPVGDAPVSRVGSTSSTRNERPDTRNSKSPRKIEGIIGSDYKTGSSYSDNTSSFFGGEQQIANQQRMTKEEYIAQQIQRTQALQNQLYGTGINANQNVSDNKVNFFSNSNDVSGNGTYLSECSLWDGTIISGALITAINTDNPGVVIARVTENVYSSYNHKYLLIPEGSLLFATYNSSVSYAQKQVQVAWNLLIRPDNYRVQLGNMNGVNAQGASGYKGKVSNHPFETLKALGLVAIFSIIQTEMANNINSEKNEYLQNSMTDVYSEASRIGNKIMDKALDIKPTIRIKEGTEIKLITNTPLELPPVEVNQVTRRYVRTK